MILLCYNLPQISLLLYSEEEKNKLIYNCLKCMHFIYYNQLIWNLFINNISAESFFVFRSEKMWRCQRSTYCQLCKIKWNNICCNSKHVSLFFTRNKNHYYEVFYGALDWFLFSLIRCLHGWMVNIAPRSKVYFGNCQRPVSSLGYSK